MANIDAYGRDANVFLSAGKASGPGPWNEATGNTPGIDAYGGDVVWDTSHSGWNAFGNNYDPRFANDIIGAHNERKLEGDQWKWLLGLGVVDAVLGRNQPQQYSNVQGPVDKPRGFFGKVGRLFNYAIPLEFLYSTGKEAFKDTTFR